MKAILTVIILSLFSVNHAGKQLTIKFNLLPEVKEALKDQPIKLEISYYINLLHDKTRQKSDLWSGYEYRIDTILINPQSIVFTKIRSDNVIIRIGAWINCTDGITKKGFYSAMQVDLPKNDTIITITFPKDCEFNRYIGGKICPKCGGMDKSIPIIWGLPSFDLPGEPGVDYDLGGCFTSACDPRWYCKRDSLRF